MGSKIKNIIIFVGIAIVMIIVYSLLFKNDSAEPAISTNASGLVPTSGNTELNPEIAQEFLADLMGIENLKLNDGIFFDPSFSALKDPNVQLISENNEGRPNPFAPIGIDRESLTATVVNQNSANSNTSTTTNASTSSNVTQ